MVYGEKTTLKMKSTYYLTTKLLGRMSAEKLAKYLDRNDGMIPWLDEDYQWILDILRSERDYFLDLPNQGRIDYVRTIIDVARGY